MILMGENALGPLEGIGPENRDFLGSEVATSKASASWARKEIFRAHPLPIARVMDLPPSKSLSPSAI
jgi:hypothetical protein